MLSENGFLGGVELTREKIRRLELLATRMAVERAAGAGHFMPTEIDGYLRLCFEDSSVRGSRKKARARFINTEPPLEWGGELHLPLHYKELLFDTLCDEAFRREMAEKGFMWAPR